MKLRGAKFRKLLICSRETGFFQKILANKLFLRGQHILLSLRRIKPVRSWLKYIESKCYRKLTKF
jgi:hypothetical protein